MRKKIEEVLSIIIILIFDIKNILAQVIAHRKKTHAQPKGEKEMSCPPKLPNPQPLKKIDNGPSLNIRRSSLTWGDVMLSTSGVHG